MAYAHRSDFYLPENPKPILYQRFTMEQWQASNFADPADLAWFQDAKYGMFIHFGLSTYINEDLSWGVCHTRKAPDAGNGPIPDEQWRSWPNEFRLEKFDAKRWVEIAQQSGFKYIVLISKHHDGFHMWDTDESVFKITNTPFGRDVVGEVAEACHAADMPFGLYYSQRDWYHPDYMPVDPEKVEQDGVHWTLKPGHTSPLGETHHKYIDYQKRAVRELCTRYGKIDIFWWDAVYWDGMFTAEMWDAEELTRMVRELQPGIIQNNRCSVPGDFDTPEQRLGYFQNWRPWESCICLSGSWSYSETPPKSLEKLVGMLVKNACDDGNLLLSWGPHWDGEFDAKEIERLGEVGQWLKANGESIYGTRGGPWTWRDWGGSTFRDETAYLHITALEGETLELPAITDRRVVSAALLGGEKVDCQPVGDVLRLIVPTSVRDAMDTIVELRFDDTLATVSPQ